MRIKVIHVLHLCPSFTLQSAIDIDGQEVHLSKYAGKVVIVVNVASACGYTDSNYKGAMFPTRCLLDLSTHVIQNNLRLRIRMSSILTDSIKKIDWFHPLSPSSFPLGLQATYEKYKEFGLEILGFPCNQCEFNTTLTPQRMSNKDSCPL